jgi:stress response protein SCP2
MKQLSRGERLPLAQSAPGGVLQAGLSAHGLALDFACFALDAGGKLADERYMTFFNQPSTPCGGVAQANVGADRDGFRFDLGRLPAWVERVSIVASTDGAASMSQLQAGCLRLEGPQGELARFEFTGRDFIGEKAVVLGDVYRKDGQWRFMAVGQGFNGGLDALVRHFGGAVADDAPSPSASSSTPSSAQSSAAAAPAAARPAAVDLEKRVAQSAPQLVNLVKSAAVSLAKAGLSQHRAKVCLVLDISGSMSTLYRKGLVQQFAERILVLGCRFDDDGEIDVFLFGRNVHQGEPMGLSNWSSYIKRIIDKHPLEGDTRYGAAIEAVRRHYFPDGGGGERKAALKAEMPVYVMFVTDGSTSDKPLTERQLRWASREPIFWQFMGIGKGRKSKSKALLNFADSDFPFLEKLDDLDGRLIDNADFFSVASLEEHSDAALYDLLMNEYPQWVRQAGGQGLIG